MYEESPINRKRAQELEKVLNEVAPIAQYFGMQLHFTEEGNAVVTLPYNPRLDHAMGAIHGGVYATLMDSAGWFTSALSRKEKTWLATAELTVHFLLPASRTSLRAIGRMVKAGKRQDVVEVNLYDQDDRLVGHAVGTFIVLNHLPLSPEDPQELP